MNNKLMDKNQINGHDNIWAHKFSLIKEHLCCPLEADHLTEFIKMSIIFKIMGKKSPAI